jgi:ATP-dependent Lon protease
MTRSSTDTFPVLPLRDIVVFPHMIVPLFVGRAMSVRALEEVMKDNREILLASQKDPAADDPGTDGIYRTGVLAAVLQLLKLPDGTVKVLVEGRARVRIDAFVDNPDFFEARIAPLDETPGDTAAVAALIRSVAGAFERYAKMKRNVPEEALSTVSETTEPGKLADMVAGHLSVDIAKKQDLLETCRSPSGWRRSMR